MKRKKKRKRGLLIAVGALVLALVAGLAYLRGTGTLYVIRDNRVTQDATEFSFTPSALQAASGEITFSVVNRGRIP